MSANVRCGIKLDSDNRDEAKKMVGLAAEAASVVYASYDQGKGRDETVEQDEMTAAERKCEAVKNKIDQMPNGVIIQVSF